MKSNVLIIGAGFAGLSTAYHLAKSGERGVVILEQEEKFGSHASGRNAGMIRQTIADPFLASLAVEGLKALDKKQQNGWKGIHFRRNGSLLLAKKKDVADLKQIKSLMADRGVKTVFYKKEQVSQKVNFLKKADFEQGLFCETDALLDISALIKYFIKELKAMGVKIYSGIQVTQISSSLQGFTVYAGPRKFTSKKLVNAAGAWAGRIGEMTAAVAIPFKAYRRHLYESNASPQFSLDWPFVWDLSHQVYFRPLENRSLLLSPCDKDLFDLKDSRRQSWAEKTDPKKKKELKRKLSAFCGEFPKVKIKKEKAGLRTMTPDGRFVVGRDPQVDQFYWVAGLGGHGVTTSLSVGRLASDIILGREVDKALAEALSPRRFLRREI